MVTNLFKRLFGYPVSDTPVIEPRVEAKQKEFIYFSRLTKVNHGLGGIRLDWACWNPNIAPPNPYWKRRVQRVMGNRYKFIHAPCELDGFKLTKPDDMLRLIESYSNKQKHSVDNGRPLV